MARSLTYSGMLRRPLQRIIRVRDDEVPAVLWATAGMFCLLCAYYILRAVRDEIGSENVQRLPDYWTTVFFVMLGLVPLYGAATRRWPRHVFVPLTNRFFNATLLLLFVLLHALRGAARGPVEWTFYVWNSAFVLFVLTVYWGFLADVFRAPQARRLFGFIAVGGSLGGILGPAFTAAVVEHIGQVNLFLLPMLLLELACLCARRVHALAPAGSPDEARVAREPVAGGVLRGLAAVARSPYLLGICLFIFLYTFGSTMIYFEKAEISRAAFPNRDARTAFYARVDLLVNTLALLGQAFLAGRLLPRLGVAPVLVMLPLLTCAGFAALGAWPILAVLVAFEVARRAGQFALGKPSREILFTVVSREEKYRSKAFLDTVVYRGSDMLNAWIHTALTGPLGLGLRGVAWVAVPAAGVWATLAWFLGRAADRRAGA